MTKPEPTKITRCEIVRTANGWIVYEFGAYDYNRDSLRAFDQTWVFRTWDECAAFLGRITN